MVLNDELRNMASAIARHVGGKRFELLLSRWPSRREEVRFDLVIDDDFKYVNCDGLQAASLIQDLVRKCTLKAGSKEVQWGDFVLESVVTRLRENLT